jgi:2-polyprenyl-3-methyl-5-hydroxy-6-metoxy-1,4-benzoquinol methylase
MTTGEPVLELRKLNNRSMDIKEFATNVTLRDGVAYSNNSHNISYPEKGNEDSFYLEENSFWFNHRNDCIVALVQRFNPDGYIFDIGGGNGYVAAALEKNGFPSVLVEPGIDGIKHARDRNLKNLFCSTVDDANFKKNSIPAIGVFDVVEHIQDDGKFLKTLHDVLKPGGKIFITVPAYSFLWSTEDKLGGHFRRYTLKSISKKLESSGFTVNYKTYIFSFLPIPIFLFRSLPSFFGIHAKKIEVNHHKKVHRPLPIFFKKIFNWEVACIRLNKTILTGGTCLVAAEKKT